MADPISVISLVEGSIGLVLQCGSVAKTLSDIIAKFKYAEVAIMSLIQEVEAVQFAWNRIKEWSEDHAEAATDSQFVQRLEKSLQCGTLVLTALEKDLADYEHRVDNASFILRSKMVWNERAFLDHQHRVRGQVQAMTLLLQVSQLSTSKAQTKLLRKKEKAFHASDESSYSIVPSRMSSHMSVSTRSRDSALTIESQELVYYPLSFEDELFTARVYKRNYRNAWISSLVKLHRGKKAKERRFPIANPEASEDGQSILSSSSGTTTPRIMSVASKQEISLGELRPVSPGPVLTAETKADPTNLERSVILSGSVPSIFEESPRISSDLQNETLDTPIKQIYPTRKQLDVSYQINPAPGRLAQTDNEPSEKIARSPPAPETQKNSNRSLFEAINKGDLNEVETWIERGAQVNPRDYHNPLHVAIGKRDVSMIKLLLREGANCAEKWRGTPPIHRACLGMDYEITQLLLDAGASATSLDDRQKQPLHSLLSEQWPDASDVIDLLVSRGADIHARTRTGETALHLSCWYPSVDNVRALLVHGADINTEDMDGNTPFHTVLLSCWGDSAHFEAVVRLLLEHGVNTDAQNGAGDTPLHLLVARCLRGRFDFIKYEAPIQLLLEHGANVNAKNRNGDTPLHLLLTFDVAWEGWRVNEGIFRSLVRYGAQVNIQNMAGDTPLNIVARREVNSVGEIQLIRGLLDAGADLSDRNLSPLRLLEQAEDRSILRNPALLWTSPDFMSEGDEEDMGVAS